MKPGRAQRPSEAEAIEARAAAWLAQRDDGLAAAEAAEFARWRAADPRHEAAVARLEGTWAVLQQLRDFRPEAARHPDFDLLRPRGREPRRAPWPALAGLAAALMLLLVAVWWLRRAPAAGEVAQDYATTVDGYQRVTLGDGSIVELNAASAIRVQFSAAERRVRLARGEAHFTVAKNPARPFFVEAGGVAVRAVGTAFNVRYGAEAVEVLVTEGRVQVAREGAPERRHGEAVSAADAAPGALTLVAANERVVIGLGPAPAAAPQRPAAPVEKLSPETVREALAWQGPRLVFVDTPLAEVVAQFNRRNPVQLILADAELGAIPVGGTFRAENLEAFVRLLATDNDIAVEYPDAGHIVLRRRR